MKKNILFLTLLCAFSSAFAQVPSVSASTKWAVIDGNTTWVPSALDFKNYCLLGLDGGTTGQVLTKDSGTDYDWSWQTPSGGGGSDFLGTGFTSGGGAGSIPDGTVANVASNGSFSINSNGYGYNVTGSGSPYSQLFAPGSVFTAGNGFFDFFLGGGDQELYIDAGGFVLLDANNKGLTYGDDYSATIATGARNVPDVGTVRKLGLEGLNTMTSSAKEALTPSEGWEVWDTDLDGKCVYDGTKWVRLSQESTPSVAVGAGAGTGATVSVVGNDIEGVITLTGGTGATASATVFTLTFFDSYTSAPHGVIISESNQKALTMPIGRKPGYDTVSTTTFTVINAAVNGIVNAEVYTYAYRVIQ